MNILSDCITYVRRIVKTPSNTSLTDALIVDYINRFWINDMDARLQLFDLKTTYRFQTTPGVDKYNMPLYQIQAEPAGNINYYPVYQGFVGNARVAGISTPFYTDQNYFFNLWPNYSQTLTQAGTGDGSTGPYTLTLPFNPALPGHVDMAGIIASGSTTDPIRTTAYSSIATVPVTSVYSSVYFTATGPNGADIVVADSGQFLSNNTDGLLYGLLMAPGNAPYGNTNLSGPATIYTTTENTICYNTGVATGVYFPTAIPSGTPINAQCYFIQPGLPRAVLFYNNVLTLRNPPDTQYLIELDCYLTPAAFLTTGDAIPFGYMTEYIARGAARKILSDVGDIEQFQFYEPLFIEQERLVWKRSQRQFTATRTQSLYSMPGFLGNYNQSSLGT